MPLLWLSLAWIGGIWLGSQVRWTWPGWLALGASLLAAAILATRLPLPARVRGGAGWLLRALPPLAAAPLALALAACLGAARYQLAQPVFGPDALARFNGSGPALITGWIAAPPEPRDGSTRLRVEADQVKTAAGTGLPEPVSVRGTLLASVPPGEAWRYGDRVELAGSPQAPPEDGDFSYREYLARQGIYTFLPFARAERLGTGQGSPFLAALYRFRERALDAVDSLFPPPESALLSGILLGEDGRIPAGLQQAFRDTGTSHIIAISGFNIAILSGLFVLVFSRLLGRRWGSTAALAAIVLYTLLVGAGASVVRAAFMGGLALLGSQLGRRQIGTNLLAVTAGAMCLLRPAWLWDVGFQLSFGATLGLVLYAQPLQDGFARLANRMIPFPLPERVTGWIGQYVLFTLAAQVFILPIQLVHFQRTSLIAPLANILVLPPQPLVMALGGLAALVGMAWLPAGQVIAAVAWPFLAYTVRSVEWLAGAPNAGIATGTLSPAIALLMAAIALLPALGRQRLQSLRPVLKPSLAILALGALSVLAWQGALAQADRRLRVTLTGPSPQAGILVQAPAGQTLLIDGGPSGSLLGQALGERLGPFARRLDALVVAGASAEALSALPAVIDRFPPGLVVWAGEPGGTAAETRVRESLLNREVHLAQPGMRLDLGEGVGLRVLGVPGSQETSGLLLEWQSFRLLLPCSRLQDLPAGLGPISLLVLREADLKETGLESWRERLQPQAVLLRGGVPRPGAVSSLGARWVGASTDGTRLWVEVGR